MTTKAVILARGLGTRMRKADTDAAIDAAQRAVADSGMKAMIPVGRPFIDYVVSALADAGITDVCLVIGPEHTRIRDYYQREVRPSRVKMHFAIQDEPLGTADAVRAAEDFAAGESFLALNSDTYYPVDCFRALRELNGAGLIAFEREALIRESNIKADRIARFAILEVRDDRTLARIVEKPDETTMAAAGAEPLVSMNVWSFTHEIFEAARRITPSPRGEYELADAVNLAISELQVPFVVLYARQGVLDLSSRGDIAGVAERLRLVDVRL